MSEKLLLHDFGESSVSVIFRISKNAMKIMKNYQFFRKSLMKTTIYIFRSRILIRGFVSGSMGVLADDLSATSPSDFLCF